MEPSILKIQSGTVLDGRFEVEAVLGRGGFATVYKARQINMGRPVALKILGLRPGRDESDTARFKERFFLEAQRAASIRHPGIVTIYDHGVTSGGLPFIAMELLSGCTLDEAVAQGAMAPSRVLPLFVRCLDALSAAHELGIVHKDLKPSNLFLTSPGTVVEDIRLLDFGIAAMSDATMDERLTGTDQFIGTAAYCCPEYYRRQVVSPAVDVYQMGLVLAEALIGRRVVDAGNALQAIEQHCSGRLLLPWALLQSPLGDLFKRALTIDPEDRYSSAAEMRDALAAIDPADVPQLNDDDLQRSALIFPEEQGSTRNDLQLQSVLFGGDTEGPDTLELGGADAVLAQLGMGMTNTLTASSTPSAMRTAETLETPKLKPIQTPTPEPAPEPEPIPKALIHPNRGLRVAFVAALVLGVGGLVAILGPWGDKTPPEKAPNTTPEPTASAPNPIPTATVEPSAPPQEPEAPAPETPAPTPEPIEIGFDLSPRSALVTALSEATPKPSSKSGKAVISGTDPLPWSVRVSNPRFKDTLLRLESAQNARDVLFVRVGQQNGERLSWGKPEILKIGTDGRFSLKVALTRQGSAGQKGTFKKKWIVD